MTPTEKSKLRKLRTALLKINKSHREPLTAHICNWIGSGRKVKKLSDKAIKILDQLGVTDK